MSKILSAEDYGFRKVFRVLGNEEDPQWIHVDADGKKTTSPSGHTGDRDEAKEAGVDACMDCKSNWQVEEYVFTGKELSKPVPVLKPDGTPTGEKTLEPKTADELIAEVKGRHEARVAATPRAGSAASIDSAVGVVL